MATYWQVLIFSLIGGLVSLAGGIALLSKRSFAIKLATYATPFAAGALLAAVFVDLLPEGLEKSRPSVVSLSVLVGLLGFFFLHRFLHWFHHHDDHPHDSSLANPKIGLVVFGDTLHNALDGVAIAASFLISVPTGIVTTIAVAAHEIPQEIGDMGLLLARGMTRRKVIIVNIVSALATTVFALVTFRLGSDSIMPLGILLGISAGFLLYIAASDIMPSLDQVAGRKKSRRIDWPALLVLLGVITVAASIKLSHSYINIGR